MRNCVSCLTPLTDAAARCRVGGAFYCFDCCPACKAGHTPGEQKPMSDAMKKIISAAFATAIALFASLVQADLIAPENIKLLLWVSAALGIINTTFLPALFSTPPEGARTLTESADDVARQTTPPPPSGSASASARRRRYGRTPLPFVLALVGVCVIGCGTTNPALSSFNGSVSTLIAFEKGYEKADAAKRSQIVTEAVKTCAPQPAAVRRTCVLDTGHAGFATHDAKMLTFHTALRDARVVANAAEALLVNFGDRMPADFRGWVDQLAGLVPVLVQLAVDLGLKIPGGTP